MTVFSSTSRFSLSHAREALGSSRRTAQGRLPVFVVSALGAAAIGASQPASAADFSLGDDIKGSFNSTVSVGVAVRTSSPICAFIGQDNGGCASTSQVPIAQRYPQAFSQSLDQLRLNQDDGDLNFKKGDIVSGGIHGVHDLSLSGPDGFSGLLRATWYYDAAADQTRRTALAPAARDQAIRDFRILDAYVTKEFEISDRRGRLRVGNQVINWGEATFVPGGVNAVNAIDVTKTHSPGAQLKELQLPAPMASLNLPVARGTSLETFYQWGWNSTRLDPVGTFFSTTDVGGRGSRGVFLPTSLANQIAAGSGISLNAPAGSTGDNGTRINGIDPQTGRPFSRTFTEAELADPATSPLYGAFGSGSVIPRDADQRAKKNGQFGFAMRFSLPDSGDEFAIYALHYHDKIPSFSLKVDQGQAANPFAWGGIFAQYPQNKNMFGASYNTRLSDWSIGTELSYRPRESVAIDPTIVVDPSNPYYCNADLNPANFRPTGYVCSGSYQTRKTQFHLTALNLMSPGGSFSLPLTLLGASEGSFLGELAVADYSSLPLNSAIPYAVTSDYRSPTRWSSGFVATMSLAYPAAFGTRATLNPDITWSQGLHGISASSTPGFVKGAGAVAVGLTTDFKTRPALRFRVDYTRNYGGGLANQLRDRDFASASLATDF